MISEATCELRILLERFANGASMSPIFDAIKQLWEDARQDEGLRQWWSKIDTFVRKALLEPGSILSPQFDQQSNQLQKEGHAFFDEKYKGHKDNLINSISTFAKSFAEDPLNKRFGQNWNALTRDLLFGEDGKTLAYKPHLWKDIRSEIIPSLVNKIGYVPIPRIEYSDDKMDLVIENLTLQGRNLFPKYVIVIPTSTSTSHAYSALWRLMSTITFASRHIRGMIPSAYGIRNKC